MVQKMVLHFTFGPGWELKVQRHAPKTLPSCRSLLEHQLDILNVDIPLQNAHADVTVMLNGHQPHYYCHLHC